MLEFIKNFRRKKIIRALKAAPRDKRIDNIQEVRSIGVICQLDTEQNWNILYHFAKVMENQGKKVHIIAMQDQEISFVVTHQATSICRAKTDINFWGLPSNDSIKDFTSRHYDLLIDGNRFYNETDIPYECIVKGDAKYMSIAAASILAKTHRDELMLRLHNEHPQYGWDRNKGYPTLEHFNAIEQYGPTPYHRRSFNLYRQHTLFEN